MNTDLSPENENFIDHAVATGLFQDRGKALNAAIDLLKRREGLIRDVNSGIDQLDAGKACLLILTRSWRKSTSDLANPESRIVTCRGLNFRQVLSKILLTLAQISPLEAEAGKPPRDSCEE